MSKVLQNLVNHSYKHGCVNDINSDCAPKGSDGNTILMILAKKNKSERLLSLASSFTRHGSKWQSRPRLTRTFEKLGLRMHDSMVLACDANSQFLRLTYNALQAKRGMEKFNQLEFYNLVREKMKLLGMSPDFLDHSVDKGFSGGEQTQRNILAGNARSPFEHAR